MLAIYADVHPPALIHAWSPRRDYAWWTGGQFVLAICTPHHFDTYLPMGLRQVSYRVISSSNGIIHCLPNPWVLSLNPVALSVS
jgi:hypothetical protein